MSEKKVGAEGKGTAHLDARVIRDTRVYEASADYEAYLRDYAEAVSKEGHGDKPAALVRARLDIEIAKDLSANILSLRNATERGSAEANALSRRV